MSSSADRSLGDWYAGWRPASQEHKRHVWEFFGMSMPGEVDDDQIQFHWHWTMFTLIDFFGAALVYQVGLQALGYPPTLVDLKEEADEVEAALLSHLRGE